MLEGEEDPGREEKRTSHLTSQFSWAPKTLCGFSFCSMTTLKMKNKHTCRVFFHLLVPERNTEGHWHQGEMSFRSVFFISHCCRSCSLLDEVVSFMCSILSAQRKPFPYLKTDSKKFCVVSEGSHLSRSSWGGSPGLVLVILETLQKEPLWRKGLPRPPERVYLLRVTLFHLKLSFVSDGSRSPMSF